MVKAAAVFMPLLGAFINAWLAGRNPRASRAVSLFFLAAGLAATLMLSWQLGAWDLANLKESVILATGVGEPPLSIDLEITAGGTIAAVVMYLAAALSLHRFAGRTPKSQPLILAMVTASLGMLYATDIFNSFVFLEIGSIITIGLIAACRCGSRWEAAMKTALVSGLVTILYLLGVAVVYRTTGVLSMSVLPLMGGVPAVLVTALFLTVIMTEIKAFPLTGWGLDLYHGSSSIMAGFYSATWSLAVLLWSARVLPMLPVPDVRIFAWTGAVGLVLSQLAGLRASASGRIMGYSTAAYASLLLVAAGTVSGEVYDSTVLVLLLFAAVSKFGLFMLGRPEENDRWSGLGTCLILFPVLALAGIPPMPTFWAKFAILREIAAVNPPVFYMTMAGLALEAVYLFSFWSRRSGTEGAKRRIDVSSVAGVSILMLGGVWLTRMGWAGLDFSGTLIPSNGLRTLFQLLFAGGTLLALPGVFNRIGSHRSYWFWLMISGGALTVLPMAGNSITFFVLWEISAFAGVIAVSRGLKGGNSAFWYAAFAVISGYLLLAALLASDNGFISSGLPVALAVIAALLKMGQFGTHLWNVRAYPDSPGTMPAFLAGTASKSAVLLLVAAALYAELPWGRALAWIGALTALGTAVKAALADDYRKMLAFASVSQLGYALMGIGLASVLGWTAAFYHTIHHLIFKMALFLGAAGVLMRAGTTEFNRLGGLVKKMPLTFAFTLIAVISYASIPPLAGFGGKWLLYNALVEAGWLPVMVVAMFASVVAFLYSYRLLHGVFLGQLSRKNSGVKEAPLTLLIPQGILAMSIMVLGFRPTILLDRLIPVVQGIPGLSGLAPVIDGQMVLTPWGTWNAWMTGLMVVGIFGAAFVFYWISGHKPKYVGQLDIGFAGELPPSPEEIHYSNNFFRPYRRALSFLPNIQAGGIFRGCVKAVYIAGDAVRALFTGDGRTYLAHIMLFLVLFFVFLNGGM